MRSSSLGLIGLVGIASLAACSVSTTSNSITVKTQKQFTDSSAAPQSVPWNGEAITINNDALNVVLGDSGLTFHVDPSATEVTVQPVFAARADDDAHESDAQAAIVDVKATFSVTGGNGSPIAVKCGHGGSHGTSGDSGCLQLKITIPSGSDTKPLDLTAGNGNGDISFDGAVTAKNLHVQSNGSTTTYDVKAKAVKGATLDISSTSAGDDITVELPSDFAADSVTLTSESSEADAITTTDFPNMKSGQGFGTAGTGAASLKVTTGLGKIVVKKL